MKKLILIFSILLSFNLLAETYFCTKELESLPIQQNGRVKPLYVHASETMKNLTGKSKVDNLTATESFCLLSLNGLGLPSQINLQARIDHVDLMKFLELKDGEHFINYETLFTKGR